MRSAARAGEREQKKETRELLRSIKFLNRIASWILLGKYPLINLIVGNKSFRRKSGAVNYFSSPANGKIENVFEFIIPQRHI